MLSQRINKIEESGIRKIFEIAANGGGEYVNLSIGQPHFGVSKKIKQAAIEAIRNDKNFYTSTSGINILKEKIIDKLKKENGITASLDEILVTAGVSGGLFLALSALVNRGDEVILPEPYFVGYKQILNFLGAKIKYLKTYPDFHISEEELKKSISPKTKLIILNSPNNPTGAIYSQNELKLVAAIAAKNNILILSDEIYEYYDYDNSFFSIGKIYKNTITLNGFSKSQAATGWRVGFVHAPKNIIKAMSNLQQYTFVCAPAPFQFALAKAGSRQNIRKHIALYKKNRDYIFDELKNVYEIVKSAGAFYYFIKYPKQNKFFDKIIKHKILAVPGNVFSENDDYFRISFAVPHEIVKKGVDVLKSII